MFLLNGLEFLCLVLDIDYLRVLKCLLLCLGLFDRFDLLDQRVDDGRIGKGTRVT